MTNQVEFAPAKVNLALHVVGRRADGYHLLDTLVAFPAIGDTLTAAPADDLTLRIEGPRAGDLGRDDPADNLVLRAARALRPLAAGTPGAALTLVKRLPVASGIGGGSADAAAAIRLLCRLWAIPLSDDRLVQVALALGADVPMCLASRPLRARGIGEVLDPLPRLPGLGIVLANPRVTVPTPEVFRRLERRENPPLPESLPETRTEFVRVLGECRNDLQDPATAYSPVIGTVLAAFAGTEGCLLARMSGSGATCFGLFETPGDADRVAADLGRRHPSWWVASAALGGSVSSRG